MKEQTEERDKDLPFLCSSDDLQKWKVNLGNNLIMLPPLQQKKVDPVTELVVHLANNIIEARA